MVTEAMTVGMGRGVGGAGLAKGGDAGSEGDAFEHLMEDNNNE